MTATCARSGREVMRETLLAIGLGAARPLELRRDFAVMREVGAPAMDRELGSRIRGCPRLSTGSEATLPM